MDFLQGISKYGSETYKLEILKKFEFVFLNIIENVIMLFEINPEENFDQFSCVDM